ncbi:MAG: helix-turn-helix domain-containing protein [Actinobacteria bacterium]|nr:helix-turn-helix domain-containing protein [Actinomycetota bacterium]MCG2802887.1 helix-turn-helix domain-containing protein [Cellulomonas sp.]
MAQSMAEPLLTPDQVAAVLGVPKTTLFRWRVDAKGPLGIRVGKHLRFRQSEVDRWLDEHTDTRGAA